MCKYSETFAEMPPVAEKKLFLREHLLDSGEYAVQFVEG